MTLYLFRHGQASFGRADTYDQLSATGHEQARLLGQFLHDNGLHFDRAFCGTLARQRGTWASAASTNADLPEATLLPGLNEHDGPFVQEIHQHQYLETRPDLQAAFADAATAPPELRREMMKLIFQINTDWAEARLDSGSFETWAGFRSRVAGTLDQIRAETDSRDTVAVFTSGGVIAAILGIVLGLGNRTVMELNWQIRNTSITEVQVSRSGLFLREFNAVPHLCGTQLVTYV